MPASFRRDTNRSLGHLRATRRPVAPSTPSARATPAVSVKSAVARGGSTRALAGASTTDTYKPEPAGENQEWPRRPRPAVCSSAITTRPSERSATAFALRDAAKAFAMHPRATSFVDPIDGKNSTLDARRPRRGGQRFVHLIERCRLDLDGHAWLVGAHAIDRSSDAAREPDVIVLDQNRVEQADAMIRRAAGTDCVLLQHPQRRRRLACVENRNAAASGVNESAGARGDTRQTLQKNQRGALAHQQGAGRRGHPRDQVARPAPRAG